MKGGGSGTVAFCFMVGSAVGILLSKVMDCSFFVFLLTSE